MKYASFVVYGVTGKPGGRNDSPDTKIHADVYRCP